MTENSLIRDFQTRHPNWLFTYEITQYFATLTGKNGHRVNGMSQGCSVQMLAREGSTALVHLQELIRELEAKL